MQEASASPPRSSTSTSPRSTSATVNMASTSAPHAPNHPSRSGSANGRNQNNNANLAVGQENKKDVSVRGKQPGKSPGAKNNNAGGRHHNRGGGNDPSQAVHHSGGYNKGRGGGRRGPHPRPSPRELRPQEQGRGGGGRRRDFDGGWDGGDAIAAAADEFEVGSVFNAGSKKQNLNHLLNFQFEPRGMNQHQRNKKQGGNFVSKRSNNVYRPKYNKEQYLQANCQFVVKSGADYSIHLQDPDQIVDWGLIEQVGLQSSAGVPSCPICLYPPVAAKIARCGHVFCWSCILHYLALSDHAWRKCPICYEAIQKEDLKSVVSLVHKEFQIEGEIELRLMRRERHSLFAVPVADYYPEIDDRHPGVSAPGDNSYSQLLTATPVEVANIIVARERRELEDQYRAEKDQPEVCFVEEALGLLSQRESAVLTEKSAVVEVGQLPTVEEDQQDVITAAANTNEVEPVKEHLEKKESMSSTASSSADEKEYLDMAAEAETITRPRHVSSSSDGTSSVEIDDYEDYAVLPEDLDISSLHQGPVAAGGAERYSPTYANNKGHQPSPKETFYFYQSSDGQAIFLHALNVQMLVKEYGTLEKCPPVIKGKIVEKDATFMTDEMRNKLRYLRHLPLACTFEVCELQLADGLISEETHAAFKKQVDERRRRRASRAKVERRREKRIQVENDKMLGQFPERKMRIESQFHFPDMGSSPPLLPPLSAATSRRSSESLDDDSVDHRPEENHRDHDDPLVAERGTNVAPPDNSGSFASMLRKAPKGGGSAMRRSNTFPAPVVRSCVVPANPDSETEEENAARPPPQTSLGDMLATALENANQIGNNNNGNSNNNGGGKKRKGKKCKGISIPMGPPRPSN